MKPRNIRTRRFPLPNDGPGQVQLPVGQVDLNRFFLFTSYKQIEEFQNSWSRASDDLEKRRALNIQASFDITKMHYIELKTSQTYNKNLWGFESAFYQRLY